MHPPLFRPHPQCQEEIKALLDCHKNNPWRKFIGECNDIKVQLDQCFRAEKEAKRKANAEAGRKRNEAIGAKKFDPSAIE